MRLIQAAQAWGTEGFRDVLKAEIETTDVGELPLQQALRSGGYALDEKPTVLVNGAEERDGVVVARVGLFFASIDAGSCCADDPSPVEPYQEYCVLQLEIERSTGETQICLLDS